MPNAATELRKLAAIMFTDMVGYSALMQRNESLALDVVREQQRLLRPIVAQRNGREVKGTGDGFLVEFASALEAVSCAIEMQKALVEYNASAALERGIQVRIGLHLGDVVVRDGDVFGDGVNIAARIEPLAEAGGVCVSSAIYEQVRGKIDLSFVHMGRPQLKNITMPVEVYKVVLPWQRQTSVVTASSRHRRARPTALALAAVVVVVGVGWWWYAQHAAPRAATPPQANPPTPIAHTEARKSVAVLPFVNMSSDKENEYFSDGITEDLITALSKVSGLHVAARTSSFAFKGKNEDIEKIGQQLHVGAVLEGSVAKAGNQVRITAQLINVADGYHLWSDSYDRELQDIFAVRSQVAQTVAKALQVTLAAGERQKVEQKPTEDLEAYQLYLKGRHSANMQSAEGLNKGAEYFRQAIKIDPNYALPYSGLAFYYVIAWDWLVSPKEAMPQVKEAAAKALEIDPTLGEPHVWLATVHWWYDWDWPAAEREFRRAIELEPNCVAAHQFYGWYLGWMGRLDDGLAEETYAQTLDPLSPLANGWLGNALLLAHRYDQAVAQLRMTLDLQPDYFLAHELLGLTYLQKGDMSAAIAELRTAAKLEDSIAEPLAMLGRGLAVAGQTDEAHMVLAELKERSTRQFVPPYVIANVYAALGDSNQAFAWLDKAYAQRSYYIVGLRADSGFDSLRTDPRFTALLKKVGLES